MTNKRFLAMLTASVFLVGACSSSGDDANTSTDPGTSGDATQSDPGPDGGADDAPAGGDSAAGTGTATVNGEPLELVAESCDIDDSVVDFTGDSADGKWEVTIFQDMVHVADLESNDAWRTQAEDPLIYEKNGSSVSGEGNLPVYGGGQGDEAAVSFDIAC